MRCTRCVRYRTIVAAGLVCAVAPAPPVRATTVVPMNLQTVANHAAQVVVGRITAVRSYWIGNPRSIESEITLDQVEYLKGAPLQQDGRFQQSGPFKFTVPGGKIGTLEMRLAGAPALKVGERWLLCLLPTYRTHPVVGITRGAFRIVTGADGVERIFDASGAPITSIDKDGFVRTWPQKAHAPFRMPTHTHNVRLHRTRAIPSPRTMTRAEFVKTFQPLLGKSRDFQPLQSAGRRLPVTYKAVPIRGTFDAAQARQSVTRNSPLHNQPITQRVTRSRGLNTGAKRPRQRGPR